MKSEKFNQFFTDVSKGTKGKSDIPYERVIKLDLQAEAMDNKIERARGHFDDHIAKSIPGHREIQAVTAAAVVEFMRNRISGIVIDVGGSEGSWANAVQDCFYKPREGFADVINVDPNKQMTEFGKRMGKAYHVCQPWQYEFDGMEPYEPPYRARVIHESMTFQFICDDRRDQYEFVKDNLTNDGIFLCEQKLAPFGKLESEDRPWVIRERYKDQYKRKYFTAAEMTKKKEETLIGMHENMLPFVEVDRILRQTWKYVYMYWSSCNFVGYLATDSITSFMEMVPLLQNTSSRYDLLRRTDRESYFYNL